MNKKRKIIIGDIHGCLIELKLLLNKLDFDVQQDDLICVGDLVERGPDSKGVVRFVRNNGRSVCGNHDYTLVKHYVRKKIDPKSTRVLSEDKQKVYDDLSIDDLEWLANLPKKLYFKEHNLLIIHAGVLPGIHPLQQAENIYMFCRFLHRETHKQIHLNKDYSQPIGSKFWTELYDNTIDIVYGHQVHNLSEPLIETNLCGAHTYGIDTGCCFGGKLSALVVDNHSGERYIEQVDAKQKYYDR
jgi:diadenosine tetraphosphatase ApaH/serine/threonine PP2A family protein phosphatase